MQRELNGKKEKETAGCSLLAVYFLGFIRLGCAAVTTAAAAQVAEVSNLRGLAVVIGDSDMHQNT
jgi:hypothetical protein